MLLALGVVLPKLNQRAIDHGCPKFLLQQTGPGQGVAAGASNTTDRDRSEGSVLRKSKAGGGTHDNIWHAESWPLVSLIDGLSAYCCAGRAIIRLCWLLIHRQMSFWSLS